MKPEAMFWIMTVMANGRRFCVARSYSDRSFTVICSHRRSVSIVDSAPMVLDTRKNFMLVLTSGNYDYGLHIKTLERLSSRSSRWCLVVESDNYLNDGRVVGQCYFYCEVSVTTGIYIIFRLPFAWPGACS